MHLVLITNTSHVYVKNKKLTIHEKCLSFLFQTDVLNRTNVLKI